MSAIDVQRRLWTAAVTLAGSGQSKVANAASVSAKPCQGEVTSRGLEV